jgi:tetratricopeptide (TPR) repeat protein
LPQKINFRLLVILVGAVAVLGGGLFFLHKLQSGRIADALLWQANRAKENGNLPKTAHFLKRYLEFQPNDLEERAYLGRTLADPRLAKTDAARERALFVLDQVVTRDPDRVDLRRPLARIAIELRRYDLAWPHLEALVQRFPRDGEVQYLLGQWHEAKEKFREAESCYRKAVAASPERPAYALRLAELLRLRLNKMDEARQVVAAARKHVPDSVELTLTGAELAPPGAHSDARESLLAGLKRHPMEPKLYQALARIDVLADHRDRAERWLRDGLKAVPVNDRAGLRWTLAHLLLDANRPADAEKEIAALRQASLAPGAIDYLRARVDICRGNWSKAAQVLERVRPKLERSPEVTAQLNLYLGQCYEQLDDPIRRLGAYEQAVALDPQSVAARLGLGSARGSMGHLDLALKDFREAMRLPDAAIPPAAWAQYIHVLIARGQQQGEVDWKEIDAALKQAQSKHPRAVELVLLRADVLDAQNRFTDAWDLLFTAKNERPAEVSLRAALIGLAESHGQLDRARLVLEEAERDLPDMVEVLLARARYGLILKGNAALGDLKKLAERGKLSEEDRARLLTGLAESCYRMGNVKEAARYLASATELPCRRNDLRLCLRLFDMSLQAEDDAALEHVLAQMRRIEGASGSWWQFATASRLVSQSKRRGAKKERLLKEADRLLDRVRVQRPQWAAVLMAKAEIAELRGNPTEARTYYKLALEGGESHHGLVRQLVQLGQSLAAKDERSPEAEQKLRLALELDNSAPEAWVALVKYLAGGGRIDEAKAAIARATGLIRHEEAPLALAVCHEAVGQLDLAQKQFQKAVADRDNDVAALRALAGFYMRNHLPRAAEPHLRRILGDEVRKTDVEAAWARRALAMVLADGTDHKRFLEALALVGLSFDGSSLATEAPAPLAADRDECQRARARVLAAHPSRACRARAIRLLEDLSKRRPLLPDDRLLLAELYEGAGKEGRAKARATLASLVADQGRSPLYLARYAQCLLDHGAIEAAALPIARLEELEQGRRVEAGTFGSSELKARALELGGKGNQALALLKSQAEGKKSSADRLLVYAACLARQNRLDEALDQCEHAQVAQGARPEIVIGSTLAFLRTGQPTPGQCDRVERQILQALHKDLPKPTAVVLQIQLAEIHDLRGQYDDAEVLYRKVLRDDPANAMALNNLAWLLAQRKGKGDEALPLIQKAIERLGPLPELLDTQAVVQLARRRSDLAIADLNKAGKEAPSPTRYFNLARAFHMANNTGAALEALQKARASGLKPENLHPVERAAYDKLTADLNQR